MFHFKQAFAVVSEDEFHLLASSFVLADLLNISVVLRPVLSLLSFGNQVEITFVKGAYTSELLNSCTNAFKMTSLVCLGTCFPFFEKTFDCFDKLLAFLFVVLNVLHY